MDFDDEVAQLHDHGVDVGIVVAPLGRIFRQHTFHGLIALKIRRQRFEQGVHGQPFRRTQASSRQ